MIRLAIDPGDIHVGWCLGEQEDGPDDVTMGEWTVEETLDSLEELLKEKHVDEVVIEEFILYADKAKEQIGSPLKTSQLIGAIKNECRRAKVPWHEQGAYIKKPTRAQLKARGIGLGKGSIHAKDAWLHYWYRTLRARAGVERKKR